MRNGFAGTLRRQCLDQVLILGERHSSRRRPYMASAAPPLNRAGHVIDLTARIERWSVAGGLISECHRAA